MLRFMRTIVALTIAVGALSFASMASANSQGQCGPDRNPSANSTTQLVKNLRGQGVLAQSSSVWRSAGYASVDGTVNTWLSQRVVVAKLARTATINNNGCRSGQLFGAGRKRLAKGTPVFVALPAKYARKDVRLSPAKGWKRIVITANFVAQATCSNPGSGKVKIFVWVKVIRPAPKPKPTPPVAPAPAPAPQQQQQQQQTVVVIVSPVVVVPPAVTPPPANQLPLCTLYKVPQHVYPNMGYDMQVSCTDPDGDPISVSASARRGSVSFTGVAGTTYTFHYIAPSTAGDDTVTFTVVDSKGGKSSVHTDFLNPVDER